MVTSRSAWVVRREFAVIACGVRCALPAHPGVLLVRRWGSDWAAQATLPPSFADAKRNRFLRCRDSAPGRVEPLVFDALVCVPMGESQSASPPGEFVRRCNRHRRPRQAIRCRIQSISFGVILFHWGEFGHVFANRLLPTSSLQRHPSSRLRVLCSTSRTAISTEILQARPWFVTPDRFRGARWLVCNLDYPACLPSIAHWATADKCAALQKRPCDSLDHTSFGHGDISRRR